MFVDVDTIGNNVMDLVVRIQVPTGGAVDIAPATTDEAIIINVFEIVIVFCIAIIIVEDTESIRI